MTVRSNDGTSIAYSKTGSGPAMLLIHGAAATGTEWLAVLPEFRQHFTVYTMERRGRAPSGDGPAYSIDRETEDVAAMIAAIGEPVVVVGHSYGALIAVNGMKAIGGLEGVSRAILYEPPVFANRNPDHAATLKEAKTALAANDRDRVTGCSSARFSVKSARVPFDRAPPGPGSLQPPIRCRAKWKPRAASKHARRL